MKGWVKALIVLTVVGAVLYYLYVNGYLATIFPTGGAGGGGGGGGGSSSGNSCTYPVNCNSPASCVLKAMQDSGYLAALQAEGNPEYQTAQQNPIGQLQSHPYLAEAYPQYFSYQGC